MKLRIADAECTLGEVAKALGISQVRAQQIEKRALKKCARYLEAAGLRAEDLLTDAALVADAQDEPGVQTALSAPEPEPEPMMEDQ